MIRNSGKHRKNISGTREALEASERVFCSACRFQMPKIESKFLSVVQIYSVGVLKIKDQQPIMVREVNFEGETRPPRSNEVPTRNPKISYKEPRVISKNSKWPGELIIFSS